MVYRDDAMIEFLAYHRDNPVKAAAWCATAQIVEEGTKGRKAQYPLSARELEYYQGIAALMGWLRKGVPDGFPAGGGLASEPWEQGYFITPRGLEYLRLRSDQALVAEAQRKQISLLRFQNGVLFFTLAATIAALIWEVVSPS